MVLVQEEASETLSFLLFTSAAGGSSAGRLLGVPNEEPIAGWSSDEDASVGGKSGRGLSIAESSGPILSSMGSCAGSSSESEIGMIGARFFVPVALAVLVFLADAGCVTSRLCFFSEVARRIFSIDRAFLPYRGTGAVGKYLNGSPSVSLGTGFSAS